MINEILSIMYEAKETESLPDAVRLAKTASASMSDGHFSVFIEGKVTKTGSDYMIRDGMNHLSFPEKYVRDWELNQGKLLFTLKTL